MKINYFLPINSANISQYFRRGIIIPSINIDGWINDIQSKFSKSILRCSKQLTNETDWSLTIVFTDEEIKTYTVDNMHLSYEGSEWIFNKLIEKTQMLLLD